MKGNAMLMPAVWGGLVIGVLSALPFIGFLNVCCCLWVITGGMLASYVFQSNTPQPITLGDGATVGLLAGLIGAVVHTLISVPVNVLMGGIMQNLLQQVLASTPDIPDNVRQAVENIGNSASVTAIGVIIGFCFWLVVGSLFAALGGLLGAVFFKKKTIEAPRPDAGAGPY